MAVIVTFPAGQRDRRHVKLVAGLQVVKAAGESAEPVQFFSCGTVRPCACATVSPFFRV